MFRRMTTWGFAVLLVGLFVTSAVAQRGGGGGRGGFGGGPPGGDAGGDFRARILERIDANGNGVIEPNEAEGRAQGFIERMARDAGINPGGPIPISRLLGGSGNRGRSGSESRRSDRGSSSGRDSNRGSSGRSSSRSSSDSEEFPAVSPFGDESVPGFGINPLTLNGKIINLEKRYDGRVLEYVERTMERYDKNKNGILERNEWSDVSWRTDPRESDLDQDGRLTKAEMAERMAGRFREGESNRGRDQGRDQGRSEDRRRGGPPEQESRRGGPPGNEGDRGRRPGGRGGFDPTEMVRRFDQNGDGVIQPDEVDEGRRRFLSERMGIDLSQPVRVEDIARNIQDRMRQREEGRSSERRDGRQRRQQEEEKVTTDSYRKTGAERLKNRKSYRIQLATLPDDLPEWWSDRDTNEDGQVTLAEYVRGSRDPASDEFLDLDSNRDGIVTSHEAHINAETE